MNELTTEVVIGSLITMGVFGYIACFFDTFGEQKNWRDWLLVSYVYIPLGLVLIAVMAAYPGLLVGALFLLGIYASS